MNFRTNCKIWNDWRSWKGFHNMELQWICEHLFNFYDWVHYLFSKKNREEKTKICPILCESKKCKRLLSYNRKRQWTNSCKMQFESHTGVFRLLQENFTTFVITAHIFYWSKEVTKIKTHIWKCPQKRWEMSTSCSYLYRIQWIINLRKICSHALLRFLKDEDFVLKGKVFGKWWEIVEPKNGLRLLSLQKKVSMTRQKQISEKYVSKHLYRKKLRIQKMQTKSLEFSILKLENNQQKIMV